MSGEIIPTLILPPSLIFPPGIGMGFSIRIRPTVAVPDPMLDPHPILMPFGRPDAPGGVGFYRAAGDGRGRPAAPRIGGLGVGRVVAGQIDHLCLYHRLAQRPPVGADGNGNVLGSGRGIPFHPCKLAVSLRDDDVPHGVGTAAYAERDPRRTVGINFTGSIEGDWCDNGRIDPILIIIVRFLHRWGAGDR